MARLIPEQIDLFVASHLIEIVLFEVKWMPIGSTPVVLFRRKMIPPASSSSLSLLMNELRHAEKQRERESEGRCHSMNDQ